MLIRKLEKQNEKLDEIILLCTSKTMTPETGRQLDDCLLVSDHEDGVSELQYFKYRIKQMTGDYTPVFKIIEMNDNAPVQTQRDITIRSAVSDILNELRRGENANASLYLDIHGGLRDQQDVMTAIVSLLKEDNQAIRFKPDNVYTVVYFSDQKKSFIHHAGEAIQIQDFVSGINEVMNYARTKSLSDYFKDEKVYSTDPEIREYEKSLISTLTEIANSIQFMDINEFERGLKELSEKLQEDKIREYKENSRAQNSYLSIFIDDIRRNYEPLLNDSRTIITEIEWCLNKGFYQQVMTLIESRMPKYYYDKKMICYSPGIMQEASDPNGKKKNKLKGSEGVYMNWVSDKFKSNEQKYTNWAFNNKVVFYFPKELNQLLKLIENKGNNASNKSETADSRRCHYDEDKIKACYVIPDQNMKQILIYHRFFKALRNKANHADEHFINVFRNKANHANKSEKGEAAVKDFEQYVTNYLDLVKKYVADKNPDTVSIEVMTTEEFDQKCAGKA